VNYHDCSLLQIPCPETIVTSEIAFRLFQQGDAAARELNEVWIARYLAGGTGSYSA
jgi:hypothetical protein